jgi:hypothetical protein
MHLKFAIGANMHLFNANFSTWVSENEEFYAAFKVEEVEVGLVL